MYISIYIYIQWAFRQVQPYTNHEFPILLPSSTHLRIHDEGLYHRGRIRHARELDQDTIQLHLHQGMCILPMTVVKNQTNMDTWWESSWETLLLSFITDFI